jgi:hypothetical protein
MPSLRTKLKVSKTRVLPDELQAWKVLLQTQRLAGHAAGCCCKVCSLARKQLMGYLDLVK